MMALIRERVSDLWRTSDLASAHNGEHVVIGGAVICRQRPGTAKGILFLSVAHESGVANAIVSPGLYEQSRLVINEEAFLAIEGTVQRVEVFM